MNNLLTQISNWQWTTSILVIIWAFPIWNIFNCPYWVGIVAVGLLALQTFYQIIDEKSRMSLSIGELTIFDFSTYWPDMFWKYSIRLLFVLKILVIFIR